MNLRLTTITGILAVACCALVTQITRADEEGKKTKVREAKLDDITLAVPEAWKQQPPSNKLRVGQFEIPAAKDDKEPAELVISFFGGGGGGVEANVTRWIGQFQSDGRMSKITQGKSQQGEYIFVDLSGTYNKPDGPPFLRKFKPMPGAKMLGVILSVKDKGNYFLKLTGPEKTVSEAAEDFRKSFGANAETEKKLEL